MRLLRALVHLVLALALLMAAVAQARPAGTLPVAQPNHHAMAAGGEHAVHGRRDHANADPVHRPESCQTTCCFAPAPLAALAPEASVVGLFCDVRYPDGPRPVSGRADRPDPRIPKRAA